MKKREDAHGEIQTRQNKPAVTGPCRNKTDPQKEGRGNS